MTLVVGVGQGKFRPLATAIWPIQDFGPTMPPSS